MKNECETSFCIVGDFDPDVVTERLGIDPELTWKKEDVKKDGSPYGFARWECGRCEEYDPYTENQMKRTLLPLFAKVEELKKIREDYDVEYFLVVVPELVVGETAPALSPSMEVVDFCHETRTRIDYDLYLYQK